MKANKIRKFFFRNYFNLITRLPSQSLPLLSNFRLHKSTLRTLLGMKTQHEVCKPEPHSTKIPRSIISHNGNLRIPRHSIRVLPKDQKQPDWTISLIQHNVNPLVDLFLFEMKANTRSRKPIFICHPVSSLSFMSLKTKLLDRVHF